jgi:hypothetical protein
MLGKPNDAFEQEADRVADAVTTGQQSSLGTTPAVQRQTNGKAEEEMLQAKQNQENTEGLSDAFVSQLSQTEGAGSALPNPVQAKMSHRIGADFSQVRVHTNDQAASMSAQLGAKAFTHGSDIYFNQGQYNPQSPDGQRLLAHELAHTVQQGAVQPMVQREEFEDHQVSGQAHGYEDQVITDLRSAANRAGIHLNAYGIEVQNAVSAFETYSASQISDIGEDVPGAGFMNSVLSIALTAIPIPGAGALLRVVGEALRDAVVGEIRARLIAASQQITEGRDTDDLAQAVRAIAGQTLNIATNIRDSGATAIQLAFDPIIIAINNGDALTSEQSEISGMFYRAPLANIDDYLNTYFGIPSGSSLQEVQLGFYNNLIRAFEAEAFRATGTTQQFIYWSTMARGRDSGIETYARHAATAATSQRREELGRAR